MQSFKAHVACAPRVQAIDNQPISLLTYPWKTSRTFQLQCDIRGNGDNGYRECVASRILGSAADGLDRFQSLVW